MSATAVTHAPFKPWGDSYDPTWATGAPSANPIKQHKITSAAVGLGVVASAAGFGRLMWAHSAAHRGSSNLPTFLKAVRAQQARVETSVSEKQAVAGAQDLVGKRLIHALTDGTTTDDPVVVDASGHPDFKAYDNVDDSVAAARRIATELGNGKLAVGSYRAGSYHVPLVLNHTLPSVHRTEMGAPILVNGIAIPQSHDVTDHFDGFETTDPQIEEIVKQNGHHLVDYGTDEDQALAKARTDIRSEGSRALHGKLLGIGAVAAAAGLAAVDVLETRGDQERYRNEQNWINGG